MHLSPTALVQGLHLNSVMDKDISFGYWLKQRRKRLDLTQDSLADRVGCATSMLQKIEAGRRRPSREFAGRLAEVLNIELELRPAFIEFARGSRLPAVGELFHPPANLPAQSTPLIGRERDVAEVSERILRENTRLITLLGPPGIGKTRLSLQVASEVRDRFENGVFFIPLAAVTDLDLVVPTIAQTLDLKEWGHLEPIDRLCHYLRYKHMLLVLDNFEQVVDASPLLAEMLAKCPLLKLLVTSRMPLRLRAERQYPVPPLTMPDLTHLPPAAELSQYAAIALFTDRAEAVRPDFAITADNAPTIAAICARLDGLPLAIELISARIKILQPPELLTRLSGTLFLHYNGLRDIDKRQHSLMNAIEWSYNLLTPEEQALFTQLGAFVGGCTLEAVEPMHRSIEVPSHTPTSERLTSLVDKSLVIQMNDKNEARFTMLEMIREFALFQLEISGEAEAVRRKHADYYLSLIEAARPQLHGSVELVNQIEREHDNLRVALRWSLKHRDLEIAYRLSVALAQFWSIHTWHLSEGRKWLALVLATDRDGNLSPLARGRLLQEAGILAYLQSDFIAARRHHQQALALARKSQDEVMIAHALFGLSNVAMNQGKDEEVITLLEECLPLVRTTGENWVEAMALNNLAEVARLNGDFERAELMFTEGLMLLDELGDRVFTPIMLDGLGTVVQYRGDYERALSIHTHCLSICQEMGDRRIMALALEKLAGVAAGQGRSERAARLLGAAEALRETIHVPVESIDRADYDRFVKMTQAGLDQHRFAENWAKGRSFTLEQVVAYALNDRTLKS